MKKINKRALSSLMCILLVVVLAPVGAVGAVADGGGKTLADYQAAFSVGDYPEGGTVVKDANSPTGYTAHIVYTNASASSALVYLGFAYFDPFEPNCNMTPGYNPWDYRDGMFAWSGQSRRAATVDGQIPLGMTDGSTQLFTVNSDQDLLAAAASGFIALNAAGVPSSFGAAVNNKNCQLPMTKYGDDTWYTCFPIISGACAYNIRINGNTSNVAGAGGTIYGGFDPDKQMWDQTNFVNNNAPTGTTKTLTYDDIFSKHPEYLTEYEQYLNRDGVVNYPANISTPNNLLVWLPPNYDPNRAEPYKVLYFCNGGGSGASVGNIPIVENLIAQGLVEPFIMVGTDNNRYDGNQNRDSLDYYPKYPDSQYASGSPVVFISLQNLAECVVPFMEKNFNVSKEASGRALAGFSQGGKWSSRAGYVNAGMFGYVASFSCGDEGVSLKLDAGQMPDGYDQTVFWLAGGCYDFGVNWVNDVTKYRDNPFYGLTGGGGGGGTFPDGSCLQYYYNGLVDAGLKDNIYDGIYHVYPGDHALNLYGWEVFVRDVLWKWTPDAGFLQQRAAGILENGLNETNLVLSGKVLTLVLDGKEFVLSTNANNRNISGEISLGGDCYLKFDIKGNGSNIKEFSVIEK